MKNKIIILLIINIIICFKVKAQNPIVQNILTNVNIDSLTHCIKQLTGEIPVIINGKQDTIKTRYAYNLGNEKAFQLMKEKLIAFGLQVDSQVFNTTGKNLLGVKKGTKNPNNKFIIGAHYDNVGAPIAKGADDNASGSAAVIEAARIFSNYSFPFTIVFALWDEEELGLLGSINYAAEAAANRDTILGYINLDMLGWDGNNDSIVEIHVKPVANSLALAQKATLANSIYSVNLNIRLVNPGSNATDHEAFWRSRYTAIGINEEYEVDFNPFWHTFADSLGKFNILFYEKCVQLAYATLASCALEPNSTLGINNDLKSSLINIYPNPASSYLNINVPANLSANLNIQLTDIFGKLVYKTTLLNEINHTIPLDNLENGTYVLSFTNNEFQNTYKLIINK